MNKESIKFAGTYVSICIGSGFATGQEIMQFFSAYGMISILSNLICMFLMCYCGSVLLKLGKKENKDDIDVFNYFCGSHLGNILKVVMPIFFFFSFVVMISGAGATINQYYGLNKMTGSIIIAFVTLISILMGINKLIDILGNIGPIIAIISIVIGIFSIINNFENLHMVDEVIKGFDIKKASESWYLTPFMYTGLNMVLATPFLFNVGKTAKNKKSCSTGGILGGFIFMISAMILNIAIISDIENLYIKEIPTLYMAKNISDLVGGIFSIMLILGIYTTAVPLLWSVCSAFFKENTKRFNLLAIIFTILGLIMSRFPFSMLVNFIYPISGVFGIVILISILIKGINLKVKKVQ